MEVRSLIKFKHYGNKFTYLLHVFLVIISCVPTRAAEARDSEP